jgi:eukaryotic-like serine/threonine-protein kinase
MSKGTTADRPRLGGMNFLVEEIIATDDDGRVVKISDRRDVGRPYALKVVNRTIPGDESRLARCRAAAEASEKLAHPAILRYHDYRDRKSWFRVVRGELLMEYVVGKDLNALAKSLTLGQRVLVFKHIAGALAHMHRRGVFHGDITPGRILLAGSGVVKVIGYGQSLLKDKTYRTANKRFSAPERMREDRIDERTEIYGVGALMYYLLTGKAPNQLRQRAGGEDEAVKLPPPSELNKHVPAALDDVILECVERRPERRPEGMFDVLKRLEDLAEARRLDDGMLKGVATPRPKEE